MPVQVASIDKSYEPIDLGTPGGEKIRIRLANVYDKTEIHPHTDGPAYIERQFRENCTDVYSVNEADQKLEELRTGTAGSLAQISVHLDARDTEVTALMKSEDNRIVSQLTSFTREEVQRVVKSLEELSQSDVKDLFGKAIAVEVQLALVKASEDQAKQMESLKMKLNALESGLTELASRLP